MSRAREDRAWCGRGRRADLTLDLDWSDWVVRYRFVMKSIAITEFKARCLALLEDVARTGEPLVVTKRGKPLARVVASGGAKAVYPQSRLSGTVTLHGDVVAPVLPREAWDAVRGESPRASSTTTRRRAPRR
jgi:prevent-host-death family protein